MPIFHPFNLTLSSQPARYFVNIEAMCRDWASRLRITKLYGLRIKLRTGISRTFLGASCHQNKNKQQNTQHNANDATPPHCRSLLSRNRFLPERSRVLQEHHAKRHWQGAQCLPCRTGETRPSLLRSLPGQLHWSWTRLLGELSHRLCGHRCFLQPSHL